MGRKLPYFTISMYYRLILDAMSTSSFCGTTFRQGRVKNKLSHSVGDGSSVEIFLEEGQSKQEKRGETTTTSKVMKSSFLLSAVMISIFYPIPSS